MIHQRAGKAINTQNEQELYQLGPIYQYKTIKEPILTQHNSISTMWKWRWHAFLVRIKYTKKLIVKDPLNNKILYQIICSFYHGLQMDLYLKRLINNNHSELKYHCRYKSLTHTMITTFTRQNANRNSKSYFQRNGEVSSAQNSFSYSMGIPRLQKETTK